MISLVLKLRLERRNFQGSGPSQKNKSWNPQEAVCFPGLSFLNHHSHTHTHTHIVRIILRHYADTNTIHEHAWEQTTEQDILAL